MEREENRVYEFEIMKSASAELMNLLHNEDRFLMADLFTITLSNGQVLRHTNFDKPVTWQGNQYEAYKLIIKRGATRIAVGLDVDSNTLQIASDPDYRLEGLQWAEAALGGVLDGARVKIDRVFFRPTATNIGNLIEDAGVSLEVSGVNRTETKTLQVRGDLPNEFVLSCDIALENATSIYGKPYPRIGAELSVTYTDNSIGYFSCWYEDAVNGTTKTLFERISAKHTIPDGKTVKEIRSLIIQARYQTSDSIRISGVDLRSAADVDGSLAELRPVGAVNIFSGRVSDVSGSRSSVKVDVKSDIELLNVSSPRNIYQAGCMRTLYDGGCKVNREKFTVNGRVTANSTTGTELTCNLTQANGWFNQGVIKFTSGLNAGLTRTVKEHKDGTLSFALRLPHPPRAGDVFKIYPGCDKRQSTCKDKFQNIVHFRGFPYIPSADTVV